MIVDTSAVIAILLDEPPRASLLETIQHATTAAISTATLLEVSIVLQRKRTGISDEILDTFLSSLGIDVAPVTAEQARIARIAYREFGKGSGHPAQLNFGDCFTYALARDRAEPLLFTGMDFSHTDLEPAIPN
jgi:ribonuclease VapC